MLHRWLSRHKGLIGLLLLAFIAISWPLGLGLTWVQNVGLLSADAVVFASDAPAMDRFMARSLGQVYGSRVQVADGTQDEEEINTAEDATAGGIVQLSAGTFHVEANDSIHHQENNTVLQGRGRSTVIIKDSLGTSTNLIRIIGALSNLTVRDMYLSMNDAAATCCFINATDVTGLRVENVIMYGGTNKMGRVFIQDSINVKVLSCEMSYAERMQFGDSNDAAKDDTALTARDTLVQGCRLTNMEATDMAIGCLVVDPRIIGNFVDTGGEGIDVSWSPYAVVEGNTVLNCAMVGLYGESGREQVFANNTVSGCGYGVGLMNIQHIATTTCGKAVITGNTIRNSTTHGIQVHGQPRVTISNNVITDCGGNGIYLTYHDNTTYESHDCIIANNTIFNFGTVTATSAGINAKYADGTRITGDLVDGNNAVEADRGINDDGTSDNCVIENNTIRNINSSNNISMTGTGHYIRGNQGWIASGELRTYAVTITAGTENTTTYFQNPFPQAVYVYETRVAITTAASASNPTYDLKIDADGAGVPDGTALHDAIPDTVGSYWSWSGAYGTDATGAQTALISLAANTGTSDWIGFCIEDAAGADTAGVIYITIMGQ